MQLVIILFLLLFNTNAWATAPTRPSTYTTGTTIRSADVSLNENTLYNYLQAGVDTYSDGSIVNADISAGAAIAYSKLSISGLITSTDITDGTIVNADINSSAAIAYSKLNLATSILNADVSASAAIVDTKLAQITTASKVSGTALTGLASTPSGAGIIPVANLGSGSPSSSNFLRGDGAFASPPSTSNVLFQYSGQVNSQGADVGEYTGTSLSPSTVTGNYRFLQGGTGTSYVTRWTSKWIKVAGVSTITVYVRIWISNNAGDRQGNWLVDVGGQSGNVNDGQNNTPTWLSFTIDVSGLTNGTAYDVTLQGKNAGTSTSEIYCSNVIGFGS